MTNDPEQRDSWFEYAMAVLVLFALIYGAVWVVLQLA